MSHARRYAYVTLVLLLLVPFTLSCGGSSSDNNAGDTAKMSNVSEGPSIGLAMSHDDLKARIAKYAMVHIDYDQSVISEPEKRALANLVEAGYVMDGIFLEQVWAGNANISEQLSQAMAKARAHSATQREQIDELEDIDHYFHINFGPWDRLEENEPFIGNITKPAGAGFYPEDLTKDEFESYIKAHPDEEDDFRDFFTIIKRENGQLVAVPYSQAFKSSLEKAASLLRDAADILTRPENKAKFASGVDYTTLATFLRSRADAFISNDYFQSDMDWMDVKNNIIDVTIGPYEVYEDAMNGYKAAFEAFIAIRNPADSKQLASLKNYLQLLENSLPIPDEHKNPNRGSESPISVVDLVFAGGDTKAGVQTIAFNLPNDERVREAKGSKKVMLKNISRAKFDKILIPIAERVLDPEQMNRVQFDAYFNDVLMHEMAHGLGPGTIKVDGKETTVGLELKELYSAIEECKADILGLYCRRVLMGKGVYTEKTVVDGYVSFLPGFFRAIRFGAHEAHGKANIMEFNFMAEKGAITYNAASERYHVNTDKMPAAVEALSHELLMIEAMGDYAGAKAFLDKYGQMTPELEHMLQKLDGIPVDIEPHYAAGEMARM